MRLLAQHLHACWLSRWADGRPDELPSSRLSTPALSPPLAAALLPLPRHPNCVSIMGIVTSPPCLVTEYCELGSLTSLLWAAREDPAKAAKLTWARRLAIVSRGKHHARCLPAPWHHAATLVGGRPK